VGRPAVAHVTPFYPPHLGGVENVVRALAETSAAYRPVTVLTTDRGAAGAPAREQSGQLVVRRLPSVGVAHTAFAPGLLSALLRLTRRDVAHVHIAHAFVPEVVWLAARARGFRVVAHVHLDVDPTGRMGWLLPTYKRHLLAPVLRAADRVAVLSEQQRELVADAYRISRKRLVVVPNGVSDEFTVTDRPPRPAGAPLRLLYVGRLSAQQNVARLLRAVARVHADVELMVVGDGEDRVALEALATRLGLARTRFVGRRRGADLLDAYRWADVFVLASDREDTPLVLLEAMAAGLPVIGTDVPGIQETIEGVGLLAAPEPNALAEVITAVAVDPALRAWLAQRSRSHVADRAWADIARGLDALYSELSA
jgi:glycosyltransferase involved in cell wall biosynthesis